MGMFMYMATLILHFLGRGFGAGDVLVTWSVFKLKE